MKNYVFCKYDNTDKCYECDKTCPSVSNILYGIVFKLPIIKQIYKFTYHIRFKHYDKLQEKLYNKYGYCENEHIKLIFGVMSGDELCRQDGVNLYTMNDLDVIYNKDRKKYNVSVEAIYMFKSKLGEVKYLNRLLSEFTNYMLDNNLDINYKLGFQDIFYGNISINCESDTLEECYARFKFIVDSFSINIGYNMIKEKEE